VRGSSELVASGRHLRFAAFPFGLPLLVYLLSERARVLDTIRDHWGVVRADVTVFLHLAQKHFTTTPPARVVARHVVLQHHLLMSIGLLCSGRSTAAHTANARTPPRAHSRHSLGAAHIPAAPAPAPALQHTSFCIA
jgi:hypothetical protein